MPRKCVGCDYTTDDPFLGKCPWCDKSLAIVTSTGNRSSARTDWRRERTGRRSLRAIGGGWVPSGGWGVWIVLGVVVGGLLLTAVAGGRRDPRPRNATGVPAGRVKIGMSLRDAVLALEPTPTPGAVTSLHDLLDKDDASGWFTYCDNSPMIRVTFRRGKVTGVSETAVRFMPGMRQVDIHLNEDDQ